ncbi:E6 [Gammapapillomavirus sp.]|uniref:Protein E6 n=1 Tax=Human papillomavirus TaxID=10566 RepID=A0A385PI39_9PAPI|nr:E6 [Gammapapillomavirus sp.]ATQ38168.1 E6 [Gammapapillomavirus sp.]AYA93614.1 MAG: E6 protein [Human papillomavirus]
MAGLQATNLEDYCKLNNISFFDLSLRCVFCKHKIDTLELAAFHEKHLSLVFKEDGQCYASCSNCLRLAARYELENFYRCSVEATCIEFVCKKPLKEIIVRCVLCYKLLDLIEKYDCIVGDLPFVLVRRHWRNYCRFCVKQI